MLPTWVLPIHSLRQGDTHDWCDVPYPGHPKGCPNSSPSGWTHCGNPDGLSIDKVMDLSRPMYIVYNEFDLAGHAAKMKEAHPLWTERQCRCVLYWQGKSRAQLKARIKEARSLIQPTPNVVVSGENFGVNLYATCLQHGLKLDPIRTLGVCRHMVILGYGDTPIFKTTWSRK